MARLGPDPSLRCDMEELCGTNDDMRRKLSQVSLLHGQADRLLGAVESRGRNLVQDGG